MVLKWRRCFYGSKNGDLSCFSDVIAVFADGHVPTLSVLTSKHQFSLSIGYENLFFNQDIIIDIWLFSRFILLTCQFRRKSILIALNNYGVYLLLQLFVFQHSSVFFCVQLEKHLRYIPREEIWTKIQEQAAVISMEIHVENFPNLSSIFEQLEQQNKRGAFSTTEPNAAKIHNQERKPRLEAQPTKRSTLGRVASDPTAHKACEVQPRARSGTSPCPAIDLAQLQGETRLTDAAKLLSNEGLTLLYNDILNPLDIFSLLQERKKLSKWRT